RVNEIRKSLCCVVRLDRPSQMNLQRLRCLENVWRLDQPLPAGRWNEQSQKCRIDPDQYRKRVLRGNSDEEVCKPAREARLRHDLDDSRVQRILYENAGNGGHR